MTIIYLPGASFGKSINIHEHLSAIRSIDHFRNVQLIIPSGKSALMKTLSVIDTDFLCFLAHSSKKDGMVINDLEFLAASDISSYGCFKFSVPDRIFLNTCYGIESGFKDAFLTKGVKEVVAFSGEVPITGICGRFEFFLQALVNLNHDTAKAITRCPSPHPGLFT